MRPQVRVEQRHQHGTQISDPDLDVAAIGTVIADRLIGRTPAGLVGINQRPSSDSSVCRKPAISSRAAASVTRSPAT
jgi:hypothetical protein